MWTMLSIFRGICLITAKIWATFRGDSFISNRFAYLLGMSIGIGTSRHGHPGGNAPPNSLQWVDAVEKVGASVGGFMAGVADFWCRLLSRMPNSA
jgi:hypothetical protein